MAIEFPNSLPDLWSSLASVTIRRTYEPGSVLFEQGQTAGGVYMIHRGKVRLWIPEAPGKAVTATHVGSGTMLGLSESICEGAHKASAEALLESDVGVVPTKTLLAFLRDHHSVCLEVVRILSEDLHGLYHEFQNLKGVNSRTKRA